MKRFMFTFVALMICGLCYGSTYYYPDTEEPVRYVSIQKAIDYVSNGDTIIVANGTYTANIDFSGKAIELKSSGGAENCIIDGGTRSKPVMRCVNDEEEDTILDGFTLMNGTGEYWNDLGIKSRNVGGGIYCYMSYPTIKNCIIRDNALRDQWSGTPPIYTSMGAGIYMGPWAPSSFSTNHDFISPTIENCKIYDNTTGAIRAGVCLESVKDLTFENNEIYGNTYTYEYGGMSYTGMAFYLVQGSDDPGGTLNFTSNVIYDNNIWEEDWDEEYMPAAVSFSCFWAGYEDTILNIKNNIVAENQGISCLGVWGFENTYIINNTFADHTGDPGFGGYAVQVAGEEYVGADYSHFWLYNNICWIDDQVVDDIVLCWWRSQTYVAYCNIEGGTGNIYDGTTGSGFVSTSYIYTGDPDFDDPGPTGYDYHIGLSSAALDNGTSTYAPAKDYEGDDRPYNTYYDIGADEYDG